MDDRTGNISEIKFTKAREFFNGIDADMVTQLIVAGSDIVLVIGKDGIIKDTNFCSDDNYANGGRSWINRNIEEVVTPECMGKIESLFKEARSGNISQPREVNHRMLENDDLPVLYKAVSIGEEGDIIFLGQDISKIASLQRRLMSSQLSMEREVSKLRGSESRFRGMFQVSEVPQIVVDAATLKIVDINRAASRLFGKVGQKIENKKILSLFGVEDAAVLHKLLLASVDDEGGEHQILKLENGRSLDLLASLFKQDGQSFLLIQLTELLKKSTIQATTIQQKVLNLTENMPDAFVMTDADRNIISANTAFLELLHVASMKDAEGEQLDAFFDRPSVDGNVLLANVREHGVVKRFATVLRSRYEQLINVEIAACHIDLGEENVLGFWMRQTNNLVMGADAEQENITRSNEQISNLVGHMPLKDIVRETTEMIEKLCIETALDLTQNNRASAAQMLGLSRQSLYSKLGKDK